MPPMKEAVPVDEVESIIQKRVAEEVAKHFARLADQMPAAAAPAGVDTSWMQALAMEIATLADQDGGRPKRLPPEEVKKRQEARDRMNALIGEARRSGHEPVYKLRSMIYMGNTKIQPFWIDPQHRAQPTEIGWFGVPNEAMEPLDDVARAIYAAFSDSIGAVQPMDFGPMEVTYNGVTVLKGGPTIAPEVGQIGDGRGSMTPTIRGRGAPGPMKRHNILGTIMPAAMESA